MYTLIQSIPIRHLLLEQLPVAAASLLIAELFYKFGSFTLECVAFLSTWYVLDAGVNLASGWWRKSRFEPSVPRADSGSFGPSN